jgi:hypothetical protein
MAKMYPLITEKSHFRKKYQIKFVNFSKIFVETEQQKVGFNHLLAIENIKITIIIPLSILSNSDLGFHIFLGFQSNLSFFHQKTIPAQLIKNR